MAVEPNNQPGINVVVQFWSKWGDEAHPIIAVEDRYWSAIGPYGTAVSATDPAYQC